MHTQSQTFISWTSSDITPRVLHSEAQRGGLSWLEFVMPKSADRVAKVKEFTNLRVPLTCC